MLNTSMIIPLHQARFYEEAERPKTVRLGPVQELPPDLQLALGTILRNSWCRRGYVFTHARFKGALTCQQTRDLAKLGYLYTNNQTREWNAGTIVKGYILRPLAIALCIEAGLCEK